ncbi:MAG: replication-associated recombination protein A [Clostridiales bacterium]|nr:replication-associated recombination protein A [Clostridiales bacterium]
MDMFEMVRNNNLHDKKPLADRMKPQNLDQVMGQDHVLGQGKLLRRSIEADRVQSMILHGPAGVGKTSIAKLVSTLTQSRFVILNAVTSGVKDIKSVVETAKRNLEFENVKTILFVDEIHRFNKLQQDALLPYVENGIITLIGATTENPYFEVNQALISRSLVFELYKLKERDLVEVIEQAIANDIFLNKKNIQLTDNALNFLAQKSNGDARQALNALELAVLTTTETDGIIFIDESIIGECIQKKYISYDKSGDSHYDVISAFIKSMRGSDPDATLHYLAKMIIAGEDPKFIARRILIAASEDVGLANSNALNLAVNTMQTVQFIGFPEARITLAHAALYVALSPKSNTAYIGIDAALKDAEEITSGVPGYLKDATNKKMKKISEEYQYPHSNKSGYAVQTYLPDELREKKYYHSKMIGDEKRLNEFLDKVIEYEKTKHLATK